MLDDRKKLICTTFEIEQCFEKGRFDEGGNGYSCSLTYILQSHYTVGDIIFSDAQSEATRQPNHSEKLLLLHRNRASAKKQAPERVAQFCST